jgi:hypothetical protein
MAAGSAGEQLTEAGSEVVSLTEAGSTGSLPSSFDVLYCSPATASKNGSNSPSLSCPSL